MSNIIVFAVGAAVALISALCGVFVTRVCIYSDKPKKPADANLERDNGIADNQHSVADEPTKDEMRLLEQFVALANYNGRARGDGDL